MAKFRAFSKVAVSALSTEPNATPTAKPKKHYEFRGYVGKVGEADTVAFTQKGLAVILSCRMI